MPREIVTLQCTDCKDKNYSTTKNKKTTTERLEMSKFCKKCRKHTSHKEVKRLPIGHGSGGILVQPDGARAYVAFGPDGFVAVIDLKTPAVVGRIDAGGNPDGLAWAIRRNQ